LVQHVSLPFLVALLVVSGYALRPEQHTEVVVRVGEIRPEPNRRAMIFSDDRLHVVLLSERVTKDAVGRGITPLKPNCRTAFGNSRIQVALF
jgi:hypothetical protein